MLKIKKIKPLANHIVTTMNMYSDEEAKENGIYSAKINTIKEYQTVLAIGPTARDVKVGDIVRINPSRYVQILHKAGLKDADKKIQHDDMHSVIDVPRERLYTKDKDGVETSQTVMILYDSDIMFVVEDKEEFNPLIAKDTMIITHP